MGIVYRLLSNSAGVKLFHPWGARLNKYIDGVGYNIKMTKDKDLCIIYFVRHGETDWNVQTRTQGHTDIPLNANGEAQAHELKEKLQDVKFDAIYSSDLQRARRTAEIITLERDIAVQSTKLLRERNYGVLEGKTKSEIEIIINDLLAKLTEAEKRTARLFPEQENDEEVVNRVVTFMREIAIANPGKTVLLISHGGIIRELLVHFMFDGVGERYNLKIHNGSYIKFESDGVDFFIRDMVGIVPK